MSTEFIRIKNLIYRRDSIFRVIGPDQIDKTISVSYIYLDEAGCDTIYFDSKEEAEKEFEKVSKLLLIETKPSQSNSSANSSPSKSS